MLLVSNAILTWCSSAYLFPVLLLDGIKGEGVGRMLIISLLFKGSYSGITVLTLLPEVCMDDCHKLSVW